VIVYHIAVTTADDYLSRRGAHRRAHLERLQGLRMAGIFVGGGPAPDGTMAELFYRLQQPWQVKNAMEEDPYWTAGLWTAYTPRSFSQFVEPWELVPVVLDGSRPATLVEGPTHDLVAAPFALIELRGAGRITFGGFFEDGGLLALARSGDAEQARAWFAESGFWKVESLTTRPLLHVL
jgi:uncharacterized protein YciI